MTKEIIIAFIMCIDIYLAAAAYCNSGIRIPALSAGAISLVSAAVLCISVEFSELLGRHVPASLFRICGIVLLTSIGVLTIIRSVVRTVMLRASENGGISLKKGNLVIRLYLDDTAADLDGSKVLSLGEALALSLVSSFDCAATGLGFGCHDLNIPVLTLSAFICGCTALFLGDLTGKKISSLRHDLSWVGGIIIIIFTLLFY